MINLLEVVYITGAALLAPALLTALVDVVFFAFGAASVDASSSLSFLELRVLRVDVVAPASVSTRLRCGKLRLA